jgi:hypothetical protein
MATQRAVSVTWPYHVTRWYTHRRVRVVVGAIVLFHSLWNSHLLYGLEVKSKGKCIVKDANYEALVIEIAKTDAILSYWLPLVLLIITSTVLTRKLRESKNLPTEGVVATDTGRVRKVNTVTLTALAVSLTYVVLMIPYSVYMATSYFSPGAVVVTEELVRTILFNRCGFVVMNFNYAVNFYLYSLTGDRFRNEFLRLVFCWRERGKTPA